MAGCHQGGGKHRVVALHHAVGALAGEAVRAPEFLRAEILRAIQRHQAAPAKTLKRLKAAMRPQGGQGSVETRLQMRRIDRIEHAADVVVGGDRLHAEQRVAVRTLMALRQAALVAEKGFALHEEQRKRRQANVGHRIAHVAALALVGKPRAGRMQHRQKRGENHHPPP